MARRHPLGHEQFLQARAERRRERPARLHLAGRADHIQEMNLILAPIETNFSAHERFQVDHLNSAPRSDSSRVRRRLSYSASISRRA